ncbi:MAG TPA: 4Fe-4S binding protein, partial [Gammaproteobacteria bacterium]|nr:4Fe-4S binding protein [Gammaproteobacteria bacterium]
GQTVGVRDYPLAIAEVFGLTFVAAIVLGLMYGQGRNKRAWCRHMCPIGLMLGVFSRIGAVQFWPKRKRAGGDAYTEKGVCPTMIDINRKEESRHCIQCFRCVHPQARGGLKMVFRRPGDEVARIRRHNPNAAEIWFLFLATGVSLGGFLWLVLPQYQALRQTFGVWAINHGWYWIGTPGPWWLMSVHPEAREVFTWLDFFMIVGFMLGCAAALTAVLAICTSISAAIAGRLGADGTRGQRFVELAYQYMPVAMVSLVIGLGGELFQSLELAGLGATAVTSIKVLLFAGSFAWSIGLGHRLAGGQGLAGAHRWAALAPCVAGSLLIGLAWWPAIFGV